MGPVARYLDDKLREAFDPLQLEIIDESHLHAGHQGHNEDGESHFRIRIVSDSFEGLSRLERHRKVFAIVQPKIDEGLHACAIEAKSSAEAG